MHSLLCCPLCHGALSFAEKEIVCTSCGEGYSWVEGKPNLMAGGSRKEMGELYQTIESGRVTHRMTDRVGSYSPRLTQLLRGLAHLLSPPDPWFNYSRQKVKNTLFPPRDPGLVLDVGCGPSKFDSRCLGIDAYPHPAVDVVADSDSLPLLSSSADAVVSCSLLEHVFNPERVVREFIRVLKPLGYLYIEMPFLQGYHPSPYDGQRYSHAGLEHLLREQGLVPIRTGMCSGPSSSLSFLLRKWLALVFSFRSQLLYELAGMVWGWITFPIKYGDLLLARHTQAIENAFGIYCLSQKPAAEKNSE